MILEIIYAFMITIMRNNMLVIPQIFIFTYNRGELILERWKGQKGISSLY